MREYNEKGFAFEINRDLTKYAQEEQINLPSLNKNIIVLNVFNKESDIPISYLLFNTDTQQVIEETYGLEDMAVYIEKYKLIKHYEKRILQF